MFSSNNTSLASANLTLTFRNATVTAGSSILVSIVTWFTLVSFIGAVIGNFLFVYVYLRHQHLRTPFNAYIFFVSLTDLIYSLTSLPGSFFANLYGHWPWSPDGCTGLIYFNTVIGSVLRNDHLLIAVNRFWAVAFPVNYRMYHTFPVANAIIIGTFFVTNALQVPVLLMGRAGVPDEANCVLHTNAFYPFTMATQVLGFILPEILLVVLSLAVLYLIQKKRFFKKNQIATNPGAVLANVTTIASDKTRATALTLARPTVDSTAEAGTVILSAIEQSASVVKTPEVRHSKGHAHNRVLGYLVVATIITWTPNHVFYTLVRVTGYWNTLFLAIQYCALYANSWLNPIICYLALPKFRLAIDKLFICNK